MGVVFENIPNSELVPGRYFELNPSGLGNFVNDSEALIVGLMADDTQGEANTLYQITSLEGARKLFGQRSMAAEMCEYYFKQTLSFPLRAIGLIEAVGATAASATVTITGAASGSGTIQLYIGDKRVSAGVASGATVSEVAEAIVAAVNAEPYLLVAATNLLGVVTLTAVHKAAVMNDLSLMINYYGVAGGEETPQGLTVVCSEFTGGATDPELPDPLAILEDDVKHDWWALPFSDAVSLNAADTALNDSTGRWSYARNSYGHAFCMKRGTVGELSTFGNSGNRWHVSTIGVEGTPSSPWVVAAAVVGRAALSLTDNPGAPLTDLPLNGILPPPSEQRFSHTERNILLGDGISTLRTVGGKCVIERLVTGYRLNDAGVASDALRNVQTVATTMAFLRRLDKHLSTRYVRMTLVADEASVQSNRQISPNHIRRDLYGFGEKMVEANLIEDVDAMMETLVVEIDPDNPNRVNLMVSPVYVKPLYMFATMLMPRLYASR